MTTAHSTSNRTLEWLSIADLHINPLAQRELRPTKAAKIAADFDPDRFTPMLVSRRADGRIFVIDGQHRIEAMKMIGWGDQSAECFVHDGLTESQEADLFLWHNDRTPVNAFDTFKVAVTAGRPEEVAINRIVQQAELKVAMGVAGGVSAVVALRRVYRHGPDVLLRTLRIADESYADEGLKGEIISGIGLLVARHGDLIDDVEMVERLRKARGGIGGLRSRASKMKAQLGGPLAPCIAAAATEINNAGRGGKKLPNWWATS